MKRIEAGANRPGFVRNLGAFEEIYWLYNQLGAHGFAYAMEVEGLRGVGSQQTKFRWRAVKAGDVTIRADKKK